MTEWRELKQYTDVLGKRMAHVESGEGEAFLFLHGNPTSSFLWREVMAAMDGAGRLLAPDLIGMGDSDKLDDPGPESYGFVEHRAYLDAWIDAVMPAGKITLVVHDWGSALGFHWAARNPDRVRAIAYMEALVRPMTWDEWPEPIRGLFQAMRSEAGDAMILEKNFFVERILPGSILRKLSEAEMAEYRRAFLNPGEDRRPTLTWPRQIPLDGEPADVAAIAASNFDWLTNSDVPKLFINAEPGAILTGPMRETARGFRNQTEVTVPGSHFIQEDSGREIGNEIMQWIKKL
ncbi:MAG: haloalkane dehalogenase [Alphaproteobacteria bacterium]